ncbi:MAG: FmdB family zinc ribbon protein [Actinomycetota bacterium]
MPVYEYACTACGERTEAKQGFDDPPLETCPYCGGKLRKLYSPVGIVFKGSGFYSTDSKKPTGAKPKKEGKKTESKSESRSESRSESKSSGDTATEGRTSSAPEGSK